MMIVARWQSVGAWIVSLVAISLAAGCGQRGPERYEVTGKVTFQGKALPLGTVMFVPQQGPAVTATIDSDGSYALRASAGQHRVAVTAVPPVPPGIDEMSYEPRPPLIPEKFGRLDRSGIAVAVELQDRNTIDLVLE